MHYKLQVLMDGKWYWVFCRNGDTGKLVLSSTKENAIPAHAIEYFQAKFPHLEFKQGKELI